MPAGSIWDDAAPLISLDFYFRVTMIENNHSSATGSIFEKHWNDAGEGQERSYRRLSLLALLSLLFALSAPLVFLSLWLCFFGIGGILFALWAIVAIHRSEGLLSGAFLAQIALSLSVISLVSVSVFWPYYHYRAGLEAREFCKEWFQALRTDNVPVVYSLSLPSWMRRPDPSDAENWWQTLVDDRNLHRVVDRMLQNRLLRTMLALGEKAEASYHSTGSVETENGQTTLTLFYAVTYPVESGKKHTFFVPLRVRRLINDTDGRTVGWQLLTQPDAPMSPPGWETK